MISKEIADKKLKKYLKVIKSYNYQMTIVNCMAGLGRAYEKKSVKSQQTVVK